MRFIKEHLKTLEPYKPNQVSYTYKLDANEGPNFLLKKLKDTNFLEEILDANLYPDNNATLLKEELSKFIGISEDQLIIGNGSNDIVELLIKSVLEKDDMLYTVDPTFSMYKQFVDVYGGIYHSDVVMSMEFSIDYFKKAYDTYHPKMMIICNPNNPTGYTYQKNEVLELLAYAKETLIVVDEAYMDFSTESVVDEIDNYPNVIVLRTLSKALGLAGIRMGFGIASVELITDLKRVQSPYHVNMVSQTIARILLGYTDTINESINEIVTERDRVYQEMEALGIRVFPTTANFIFFYFEKPGLADEMYKHGILIRKYSGILEGYLRVTIASKDANDAFLNVLKEALK